MKKNVIKALKMARPEGKKTISECASDDSGCNNLPLPTQKGPVLPLVLSAPPKSVERTPIRTHDFRTQYSGHTIDHAGEGPGASEGANLAHGSSNTVELTTETGGASLCGKHTETVTGAELAEAQEDTVDDGERADVDSEPNQRGCVSIGR